MLKNARILALAAMAGLLCLAFAPARAQESNAAAGRFCVDVLGTEEGLPQSSVITMIQARDGALWLGTLSGLARFDGRHFSVFDESNTRGLPSGQIVKLFEDSQRNLWLGTETAGAALIRNGVVTPLDIGRGSREGRLIGACEAADGAVWLCTADRQAYRHLNGQISELNRARFGPTLSLIADAAGQVWRAAENEFQLLKTSPDGAVESVSQGSFSRFDFLLPGRTSGHWRIADGQIQKWGSNGVTATLGAYPWPTDTTITAACEDGRGGLAVGTLLRGLYWLDASGQTAHLSTNNGLANENVLSLRADASGSLWVGTDGGGLNRVRPRLFTSLDTAAGLVVRSVCDDRQGGVWFTSGGKRISHYKDGELRSFSTSPIIGQGAFRAILTDAQNQVWVSTFTAGVLRLQGERFDRFSPSGAIPSEITALCLDSADRLWAGTQGGLALWDGAQWSVYTTQNGLSANLIQAMVDDGRGSLWIGTERGGLNRLYEGQFSAFRQTNGFPSDNISALYADAVGVLWIGTPGSGLIRFANGAWTHYTTLDGLISNGINYLIEDGLGNLWIGSNRGLMRIRKQALNDFAEKKIEFVPCSVFTRRDGLPATECTVGAQPAACRTRDGLLWFPTIAGLACADPAAFGVNTNPPPVSIESIAVEGRDPVARGIAKGVPASITVSPGSEHIDISFGAINLENPNAVRFKYRMENHEATWSLAREARSVSYSLLPPGEYTFRVTACNEDGFWNTEGASVKIIVLPPFWSTWWFRTGAIVFALGLITGAVYYVSTQRLQRQLERLRQQEALEKERARIARDIHDQVGASLTQVSLLGEMVESDKDFPEEVQVHAKLISQTARETSRALDEIVWTVNPSNDTLEGLANYICKNAQDYLAMAGLRYRFDVPPQLPAAAITPEARHNVFLAAREAVNNVVKHAKATEVSVRLSVEAGRVVLEIEDDGRGLADLADPAKKLRNGMRNMRKRMEDIGGSFEITPGAQRGAKVRLTAPIQMTQT